MERHEGPIRVDDDATRDLVARAAALAREHDPAEAARRLARLAGARVRQDHVEFGVWLPDLAGVPDAARDDGPSHGAGGDDAGRDAAAPRVELELLTLDAPPGADDPASLAGADATPPPAPPAGPGGAARPDPRARPAGEERHPARRQRLPMVREGAWAWLACRGATLGTRERLGSLYRVVVTRPEGEEVRGDPLAASLPFGAHGPAELYDVPRMHQGRDDVDYFRRLGLAGEDEGEPPRLAPPAHLLQVHVGTATHGGTLADLTDLFRALADKVRAGEEPTPGEACFLGHDALQLLPLEPVVADPAAEPSFEVEGDGGVVMATLRPPGAANWGYDGLLHGAAALEPTLLRSGRPDELVELASVLHTFPGKPIRLVLDLVLGHAHEGARTLLPDGFLAGEGAYGPRPDLADPTVRALLLEAQRRKLDFGADGVRIDAAHDLEEAEAGWPHEGDAFLDALASAEARVAEVRYRPFAIFEHARPPGDAAGPPSFRAVVERREDVLQWGPLGYERADPHLAGWWGSVWWRLEETAAHGSRWVTGHADHDTMRSAATAPLHLPPAWRLGPDRPAVMRRAFDLPAAALLTYGLLPGVPQTFLAASLRAPWAFFRETGAREAARTAAAEAAVLSWRFTAGDYAEEGAFPRLKAAGLHDHAAAVAYFAAAAAALGPAVAGAAARAPAVGADAPPPPEGPPLEEAALALMADLRDACVAWNGERWLDPAWVGAARALRRVRADRPWLARDLHGRDRLARRVRPDGSLAVVGVRHAPDGGESVALLANLAGEPWTVTPAAALGDAAWDLLVASPGAVWQGTEAALTLADGEGVLLCREL